MEQLSPEDGRILALESSVVAGHISKVLFLGGTAAAAPLPVEDVVRRVASRLGSLPRLRLRLAPDGHAPPAWVADERLVAARHVRRLEGVDGGGVEDLRRALGRLVAERLPRDRPLWRLDVVEALDGGRSALVFAAHHCLLDGEGALQAIRTLLFDEPPEPAPGKRVAAARSAGRAARHVAGTVPVSADPPHDRGLAAMAARELLPTSASG